MPLSQYLSRIKIKENRVFDPVRKKWLVVQPEELVRQALIIYLTESAGCSLLRLSVEKAIQVGQSRKRFDLVYHDQRMQPLLLVECKSPDVPVGSTALEQAVWYNYKLRAPYLLLTNGITMQWYEVNAKEKNYQLLEESPDMKNL